MGKGDKRSKRGKIFRGTFGKSRPKNKKAKQPDSEQIKSESEKGHQE